MIHHNLNNQPQHIRRLTYRSTNGKAALTFSYAYPPPRPTPAADNAAAKNSETASETDNWLDKLDQMVADLERKSKEDQEALRMREEGYDGQTIEEPEQRAQQSVGEELDKATGEKDWIADREESVLPVEEEENQRLADSAAAVGAAEEETARSEEIGPLIEEEPSVEEVEILAERSVLSEVDLLMPDR
jgi:hypothetical protein